MAADRDKLRDQARALFAAGKVAEALRLLEPLVGPEGKGDIDHVLLYASLVFSGGNPPKAAEFLLSARKYHSQDKRLSARLGLYLAAAGRDHESLPFLLAEVADNPDDQNCLSALAFALTRLGREDEARSYGRRVLELRDQRSADHVPLVLRTGTMPRVFKSDQPDRNIIAWSLWGENSLYLDGAMENARLVPHLYPEWMCRFYVDGSVPRDVVGTLLAAGAQVIQMPDQKRLFEGLFWRFHVVSDPDIDHFLIRDADSLLTLRDRAAVMAWVQSDKPFHLMRDSAAHTSLILAGAWGGVAGCLPDLASYYAPYLESASRTASVDQTFLGEVVWPAIKKHALIHDDVYDLFGAEAFPASAPAGLSSPIGRKYRLMEAKPLGSFTRFGEKKRAQAQQFTFVLGPYGSGLDILGGAGEGLPRSIAGDYQQRGNTARVEHYWRSRLSAMKTDASDPKAVLDPYALQGGLLENLILLKDQIDARLFWLRMPVARVAARLLTDMQSRNASLEGLTLLGPAARRKIVDPAPLKAAGTAGAAIWYAIEQQARQFYFHRLLAGETGFDSHWLDPDDALDGESLARMAPELAHLAKSSPTAGPEAGAIDDTSLAEVESLLETASFDAAALADKFYEAGRRLG